MRRVSFSDTCEVPLVNVTTNVPRINHRPVIPVSRMNYITETTKNLNFLNSLNYCYFNIFKNFVYSTWWVAGRGVTASGVSQSITQTHRSLWEWRTRAGGITSANSQSSLTQWVFNTKIDKSPNIIKIVMRTWWNVMKSSRDLLGTSEAEDKLFHENLLVWRDSPGSLLWNE